jgi:2-methylcitrate dehydratase PrpD
VRELGGKPEATVFGANFRTTTVSAAFANGIAGHCMDYDDTWLVMAHPSIAILPTAFALGEKLHASGKAVLEAYLLTLEFMGRIPMYSGDLFARGWHPTGAWGSLGACAAAAKLMKLDAQQMRMAFGIAATSVGGLHKNRGTMGKSFHAGHANAAGLQAALMAKLGFAADDDIMDGAEGWAYAFAGEGNMDLDKVAANLGKPWGIMDMSPGLCIKKHPCGYSFHWALDAAIHLIRTHGITHDKVAAVEIGVRPGKTYATDSEVQSRLRAKFSMEYLISAALVDGRITRHTFDDDKFDDPKIRAMMPKITLAECPLPPEYPLVHNNPVTITLTDGRRFTHQISHLSGYPDVPISREDLLFKYRDCASAVLPPGKLEASIARIEALPELDDVAPLIQFIASA